MRKACAGLQLQMLSRSTSLLQTVWQHELLVVEVVVNLQPVTELAEPKPPCV